MMRHAGPAKLVTLSVALVLHGVLAVALVSRETTKIEGSDGGTVVRLGNAFADMAVGTLSAERAEMASQDSAVTAVRQEQTDRAQPAQAEQGKSEPTAATVESETPELVAAAPPVPVMRAAASAPVRTAVAAALEAEALQPPPVSEPVEAEVSENAAVARSLRPKPRSAGFEAAHKPVQMTKPKPQPAAKPAQGNAQRSARAGEATGQAESVAQQSGTGGQQKAAGNAAASNYPGLVMRKLSRAGKPRVNARGTAVVAFSIAANGGLSSVSLARSSGSAALDQAALRLVRGAGPFPKPPAGARRSFSIQIKGR